MAVQVVAGYWDLDLESRELLLCTRSRRMFGFPKSMPKRLRSHDWEPRIHPDDLTVIDYRLETAERRQEVYTARFRTLRPDGSSCQILGIGRTAAGNPKRFVGLNFDLGEAAATAAPPSRNLGSMMMLASASLFGGWPANENDSRPWRAWSPVRAAASRIGRGNQAFERQMLLRRAQAEFERRQLRKAFLNPGMLGEPAFDLLLALYLAAASVMIPVRVLSSLAAVTTPVAVRWLRFLVDAGLVVTVHSEVDDEAGAMTAALTEKGRKALDGYFKAVGRAI